MHSKDYEIEDKILKYLQQNELRYLLEYLEQLDEKQLSRHLYILEPHFPSAIHINDEECFFIRKILSNPKSHHTSGLLSFLTSISGVEFTPKQKLSVKIVLKENMESICENGSLTFDLDNLLLELFSPLELYEYFKTLLVTKNQNLCSIIFNITEYSSNYFEGIISSKEIKDMNKESLEIIRYK